MPGDYSVMFVAPEGFSGVSPFQEGNAPEIDSDANPNNGLMSNVITLEAGDNNDTIDAGFFKVPGILIDKYTNAAGSPNAYDADTPTGPEIPVGETAIFTYKVRNTGETPLVDVMVTDDNGTPDDLSDDFNPTFVDGDINGNHILDPGEQWIWNATHIVTEGQYTNIGKVKATDPNSGQMVMDDDPSNHIGIILPGTIGNFVWNDVDKDGIQDANELGIAGATVKLLTGAGVLLAQKTTDVNGLYQFTNLNPGDYRVMFVNPDGFDGVSPFLVGNNSGIDSDANPNNNLTSTVITLANGETNNTIDAGFFQNPASLGDFVWNDLNANGIQDAGELGVDGVKVTLTGAGADGLFGTGDDIMEMQNTANGGQYLFNGLTPGDYKVTFSNLPAGFVFTQADKGTDDKDSDANPTNGMTPVVTLKSGDNNLTLDAGIYNPTPGIKIIKDANQEFTAPNTPVTYTYSVSNTGGVALANVTVTDDNATPNFIVDDFNPTPILANGKNIGDLDGDNLLDTNEIWKYTATVIPPVEMDVTYNGVTYDSGTLSYQTLANGDIRVFYRQSQDVNDNNYTDSGNAPTWNRSHKFNDLVGSDKAGFEVRATDGTVLFKFYQDYISASGNATSTYSGYQSLGISGGDGKLESGGTLNAQAATLLKDFDSTLELNLNRAGYTTQTVNSPIGDANWDYVNGYYFTISAAAFNGGKTFGGVTIFDQHNSPSKVGTNSLVPEMIGSVAVNTAVVTGVGNGTTVTDHDDASVVIVTGPLGSIGDRVWFDTNANGVQDSGEAGISGVKVTLTGDFNNDGIVDYTATTTTGANGIYNFGGLPSANYKVTVDAATLPANYIQTYDLDGLSTPNMAVGNLASGQNRTDFDFGYVGSAPGFSLVKTANKTFAGAGTPVTYTYEVTNTGSSPLSNVVIKDDNATPNYAGDDFNPTALLGTNGKNIGDLDGDNLLDTNEIWKYTATVIPPVQMTVTIDGTVYDSGILTYTTLANGDIRVNYLQDFNFNDNTYGTGSDSGWTSQGKTHTFSNLTGSDKAGFEVKDGNGTVLFKFYQDYITSSSTNIDGYTSYSGYESLGISGGDGGLENGGTLNASAATLLYDFDSTLETNLNQAGYTGLTTNSPINDPNWNDVNGYSFTVKASAFGTAGFGGVSIFDQHNSPAKTGGSNSYIPEVVGGSSTNTAVVTAQLNGNTVVAVDDATVAIITGPLGSIGDRVWFDTNANGVQDSGEAGISGVKVTLTGDFNNDGIVDYTATTTTGANGIYNFGGLPSANYKVTVDAATLPANYIQTYDLDGLSTPNMAVGNLASGQNRTDFDFGYVGSAPGFSLVKTANKTSAAIGEKVTFTYEVYNTGSSPLSNVVIKDDNATPNYAGDDFNPTAVLGSNGKNIGDLDGDNQLDTNEIWKYTATVIPPVKMDVIINGTAYDSGILTYTTLANGDIRVNYLQDFNFNDNTYGTGSDSGWTSQGKTHTFSNLTGSDKAGFEVKDGNGTVLFKFYQDYITSSSTNIDGYTSYSGFQSLGFSGGDGGLISGGTLNASAGTLLYDFDSTLETNLNQAGYTGLTTNSPINDPNWNNVNGYSFTVKASAFGTAGFGGVNIFDQHNSPAKTGGSNSYIPEVVGSSSTNTAVVTATLNGNTVVAVDDATVMIGQSGGPDPGSECITGPIGGIDLGDLTKYLFFFANGSQDANWQGATKGFAGDVVVDGIQATERTSGGVPYAGTIYTNASTLGAWQGIVDQNPGQANGVTGQTTLVTDLETDLLNAFTQINALAATPGYTSVSSTSLNGLNTQDGIAKTYVINITSGLNFSSQINITGDASDTYVLRWDTDGNPNNGYQGQVKPQSGGAINPLGGLTAANFINVAGDINASGGGSNPSGLPQGPIDESTGTLINGGSNFSGGGFFTGYWLTTGDPTSGDTASLSNAIFTGGWYTLSDKFSMTSGTSGVHICPNPATMDSTYPGNVNNGGTGVTAPTGDLEDAFGKPTSMTFTYIGGNVINTGGKNNNQDGKTAIESGAPDNDSSAYIVVSESNNVADIKSGSKKVYFAGNVDIGQSFTASLGFTNEDKFENDTRFLVFEDEAAFIAGSNPLQVTKYKTDGSEPITLGDKIAGVELVGYQGLADGYNNHAIDPLTGEIGKGFSVVGLFGDAEELTFRYDSNLAIRTGGKDKDLNGYGDQDGNAKILSNRTLDDDLLSGGSSFIRVSDKSNANDLGGKEYFEGVVGLGQEFTASVFAPSANTSKFGSNTYIHFFDDLGGTYLGSAQYKTDGSQPMQLEDELAGATLIGFQGVGGSAFL
ncbi:SdrD B-like domain-containing protein [Crocosphaera sp. XPORK-15E]|uniref:SdrD B-like domain-containing protein n=1 Tax=Crocosphaera sp. XPORK-15E TaxID=3110247 RepID=UPI002B206544|nr:SdrD B-like domain-containing protein [Crocosphaera sp. XPORK-15E]MEA5534016.1 SdrD B-like domain-containing protein [Crocosphaera sp. XPORK-15E]